MPNASGPSRQQTPATLDTGAIAHGTAARVHREQRTHSRDVRCCREHEEQRVVFDATAVPVACKYRTNGCRVISPLVHKGIRQQQRVIAAPFFLPGRMVVSAMPSHLCRSAYHAPDVSLHRPFKTSTSFRTSTSTRKKSSPKVCCRQDCLHLGRSRNLPPPSQE